MALDYTPDSERWPNWARRMLGYLALLLLPPLLFLLVYATKFQGLRLAAAQDHAQIARRLAAGDGFTTGFVRPLSLAFRSETANHPDLYNAPLPPLVLALAYATVHPSDRVTVAVSGVLWILSVWLTYAVARRWRGPRVAALAAVFYACNVAALQAALGALPYALTAMTFLLAWWLAVFPSPSEAGAEPPAGAPGWRMFLAGAACALVTLSQYVMFFPCVALAAYAIGPQPRKVTASALLAAGFLMGVLPWVWRNAGLVGAPWLGVFPHEALADTGTYPGETVWRLLSRPPDDPVFFVFLHPVDALSKCLTGLMRFRDEAASLVDPFVCFLCMWAAVDGAAPRSWLRLVWVAAGSLALGVAASCALRAEPGLFLVWAPLLAVIGAAQLTLSLPGLVERLAAHVTPWVSRYEGWLRRTPDLQADARRWSRRLIAMLVGAVVGIPLVYYVMFSRPAPPTGVRERMEALACQLPARGIVITDQPATVAWYADRRAVWMFQKEKDLDTFERVCGPPDAIYVTSAVAQLPAPEWGDWWTWATSLRGTFRGLAPADPMPFNAVLRLRQRPKPP